MERDSSSVAQKKPINSDRMTYEKILEKQKKSIIEIMNEAALKLSKMKPTPKPSAIKASHNRVSSMAIPSQKSSARFEKPNTHITYNNFFKTKNSNSQHKSNVKKTNNDENYYVVKKREENNSPIVTITKAGHKYTKSDPNLVFPKMTVVSLENNISDNNSGIKSSSNQKRNGNKLSANLNLNSARSGSSQFYTINQNNILNIYFGEDSKCILIFKYD